MMIHQLLLFLLLYVLLYCPYVYYMICLVGDYMLTLDFEMLALFLAGAISGTYLRHLHVYLVFLFIIAIFVWIDSLLRKFF